MGWTTKFLNNIKDIYIYFFRNSLSTLLSTLGNPGFCEAARCASGGLGVGADSVRIFLDGLPLRQGMVLLPPIVEALAGSALFLCSVSVIGIPNDLTF